MTAPNVLWLQDLRLSDLAQVGGKNSSLGEMIGNLARLGVSVPGGFATTADAFKDFVAHNDLHQRIYDRLATIDVEDVPALTAAGKEIRGWVIDAPLQPELEADIRTAYAKLCADNGGTDIAVAVRSSATAEDLPDASFAGQQETFLNIRGADDVVRARSRKSSPPCSTTAPSPTACTRASTTSWSPCPPACSAWFARKPAPPG